MSALLEYEPARPREPWRRTASPPKLSLAPPPDDATNATVRETIVLHYCGLIGSPDFRREILPGARARLEPGGCPGLVRAYFEGGSERGTLVDLEHFDVDDGAPEDVRRGS